MTNPARQKQKYKHRCPVCKQSVAVKAEFFPFCSPQCKTIDLGQWLNGHYKISRPIEQHDLEQDD